MKALTKIEIIILIVAIIGAIAGLLPGVFIIPVDYVYESITGIRYVDITKGIIAYYIFIPIVAILTMSYIVWLLFKEKRVNKFIIFLFVLFIMQSSMLVVSSGIL